ncbi:hypothetical protein AB4Y38_32440 [Paraburkholderia sp. EG285A]|uniref:hypothetical protein n=1 Tax=Paraburkholderia sp. EG285A TaxID=3237009 RepID=UPI0034D1B8BA
MNNLQRLDAIESNVYQIVLTFLGSRLNTSEAMEWALSLNSNQRAERLALLNLLGRPAAVGLSEPWGSAWRFIEEAWASEVPSGSDDTMQAYDVSRRLSGGDRSGAVLDSIVDLVRPRVEVKAAGKLPGATAKYRSPPQRFDDLLSVSLTSGELVDLEVVELANISEIDFLRRLAIALDAVVEQALDDCRRIQPVQGDSDWRQGFLYRAHYVTSDGSKRQSEPDAFHRGIAPSVKLLHAVVQRLAELDVPIARSIVARWAADERDVRRRLWAACALNSKLVPVEDVTTLFQELGSLEFWNLHAFPEIAELRASRFSEYGSGVQIELCRRIMKGPPRSFWRRKIDSDVLSNARRYWAIRELQRIRAYGHALPTSLDSTMAEGLILFPDLAAMEVSEGLPGGVTISRRTPTSGEEFDELEGLRRLTVLDAALRSRPSIVDDSPAQRARDWLAVPANLQALICDMEASSEVDFSNVWETFGWSASPTLLSGIPEVNLEREAGRTLALIVRLSDATVRDALRGVCHWLSTWASYVVQSDFGFQAWLRLWSAAVDDTNRLATGRDVEPDKERRALANARSSELDVLNSTVGKLVEVFFAALRARDAGQRVFEDPDKVIVMRDTITAATGRAGLIARHRLTEVLPYFLSKDEEWADRALVVPLLDSSEAIALWEAVARRTQHYQVLSRIGKAMAAKIADSKLSREAKRSFVFSLVVDALHGYLEDRPPSVDKPVMTQVLRALDDDVRARAAESVQEFVSAMSRPDAKHTVAQKAALVLRGAAVPFLEEIWPQERSLSTPGVSRAFARLPAASGDAFVDAVSAVERFIVPFDCWSMIDFNLYGDFEGRRRLAQVDSVAKAEAFLRLLDLAVGTSETAVIPNDLADALQQIRNVSVPLTERPEFRRLSTAARR